MSSIGVLSLLALANIAFGAGYPFVKSILVYLDPAQWLLLRAVASTLVLVLYSRKELLDTALSLRDIFWIAIASLFGVILNQIFFVEGLQRTLPAHAAMINATVPLQTLLLGALFLNERLSLSKIAAIILGLLGILYLLGLGVAGQINPFLKGDMLSFANAAMYSIYLIIARYALGHIQPKVVLTWMTGLGIIGFGIHAHWTLPINQLSQLPNKILFYMTYLIIVPSVIGYGIYLWALKRVEASQAALFCYMQPVSSGILSFILLGDLPEHRFYISAGLILAGILIGNLKK